MDKINLNSFLNSKDLINILPYLLEDNIYFFKSSDNKLSFLAWGEFEESKIIDTHPMFIIGNFEGSHKYQKANNYIFINNNIISKKIHNELKLNFDKIFHDQENSILNQTETPNQKEWDRIINESISLMKDNVLEKIVLSRNIEIEFSQFHSDLFLKSILEHNSYATHSYFIYYKKDGSFFISLTPEQLFKLENNDLQTMSLAGSMPMGNNEDANSLNESILLNDHKLVDEHEIVSVEINKRLNQICNNVFQYPLSILKLKYIQHRMHLFKAKLDKKINIFDVINVLHPTPAVGGLPSRIAQKVITELESKKRQYYAAPFGIATINLSEVAVALRSATFKNNKLTIHAGCGVTKESDAIAEWNETANKMNPILNGLKNKKQNIDAK